MPELSTRREFLNTTAKGTLVLATIDTSARAASGGASHLLSLGQAWQLNLEQQRIAGHDDDRLDHLVDEECELAEAIRNEPAHTSDELAIKARVVLRETGTFGVSYDIAASLAQDLIRLAAAAAGGAHA